MESKKIEKDDYPKLKTKKRNPKRKTGSRKAVLEGTAECTCEGHKKQDLVQFGKDIMVRKKKSTQ